MKNFPNQKKILKLIQDILSWYFQNQRDLPWRKTQDPYCILVSEIMLQQTQVDRVIPKYLEFQKKFPTARKLAQASTADVICMWKGLGYNRRAVYLQRAAKAVVENYGAVFPSDFESLKSLPGVGDYTARALLSFAFDHPVPVIDTNHRKFYQRVLCDGEPVPDKILLDKAQQLVAVIKTSPMPTLTRRGRVLSSSLSVMYHWNQALMDFMSAVSDQKNQERLMVRFRLEYPIKVRAKTDKKSIRFKDTDRYIRGRVIDQLRELGSLRISTLRYVLPTIDDERYKKILVGLVSDGLISKKGDSILLPD